MNFETLKTQVMAMNMVKTDNSIKDIILSFVFITFIEQAFIFLKILIDIGTKWLNSIVNRYTSKLVNKIPIVENKDLKSSSIILHRNYDNNNNNDNYVDSIIDYISNCNETRYLKYKDQFIINNNEPVKLTEDIMVKLLKITEDNNTGKIQTIELEIFSNSLTLKELKRITREIEDNYTIKKKNKLGDKIYYFNSIVQPLPLSSTGNIDYTMAKRHMAFSMIPFHTNKNLDNIFGEQIEIVKNRVRFFLNNRKWYEQKGVPYTLGILLSGIPGAGKTSLIKAIAKESNRHIVNISINDFVTRTQLNNLFFDDKIQVEVSNITPAETYIIPQRIYVIEDIDCMTDVVMQRHPVERRTAPTIQPLLETNRGESIVNNSNVINSSGVTNIFNLVDEADRDKQVGLPFKRRSDPESDEDEGDEKFLTSLQRGYKRTTEPPQKNPIEDKRLNNVKKIENARSDQLDLSFLLNLLDGVLETPGRILIITSNYPEKLDSAFIRPGRIDINIRFDNCTVKTISEMIRHLYDVEDVPDTIIGEQYTPAEVNNILFKYIDNKQEAIKILSTKRSE